MIYVLQVYIKTVKYLLDSTTIDLNHQMTKDLLFGKVKTYKGDTAIKIARRENTDEIVTMLENVTTARTEQVFLFSIIVR